MPLKRLGVLGSGLGVVVLSVLMLRAWAPSPATRATHAQATGANGPAKPKPAKSPAVKPNPLPEEGPWKASQAYFANNAACPSASNDLREGLWCIPIQERVQAIIAIVPDPINTHSSLGFDRALESIQLAAESMNYLTDRYWLPWDPSAKFDWPDYDSQQKAEKDEEQNERQPGLLLFRWNGEVDTGKANILYIFVVSETATAGVNGEQFTNAVQYLRLICGKATASYCPYNQPIRILGPTFSGSLASLVRLTRNYNTETFTAYSGTVSSLCAIQNQHLMEHSAPCDSGGNVTEKQLVFRSFVSDTESSIKEFLEFLTAQDIDCKGAPPVALLSETATAYGAATSFTPHAKPDVLARCTTRFSYPRDISSLRNAYKAPADAAAGTQGTTSPYLSFTLADREPNKSDEPPDFSKLQGPLSKEAALMSLAGELKRNEYKYIGVSGSNVLDVLFLSNFLRSACPDARLFIANADLLFDRTLDNAPYIGTLSVATYPQVARNLDWTSNYSNLPRLPFPDQFEQGQYNAFLVTLQEVLSTKNTPRPREIAQPFTPEPPVMPDTAKLPIWLTVVGTGGYWPVRLLAPDAPVQEPPVLKREDFSTGWKIILMILCGLALLHIYLLETVSPVTQRFRDFAVVRAMPTQRLLFIHIASATLAVALGMMVLPAWTFGWQPGKGAYVVAVLVLLSAALLLVFWLLHHLTPTRLALVIGLSVLLVSSFRWDQEMTNWRVAIVVFLLAILVLTYYRLHDLHPITASISFLAILISIKLFLLRFALQAGFRIWMPALIGAFLATALPYMCWRVHKGHFLRERWMQHTGMQKEEHATPAWAFNFVEKWLAKFPPKYQISEAREERRESLRKWALILVAVVIWVASLALGIIWWFLFHDSSNLYGFFFAYRSLYLATGVSPFTPMLPLLATMYCWSILEVWRLRFSEKLRPKLELPPPMPGSLTEKTITVSVSRFFLGSRHAAAFIAIFCFWLILFDPSHPFESFENRSFSWIYAALFSIGVAMMLSCGLRLWQVWSRLRTLLRELERSPLRLAFSRLKGFTWSPIWRQGGEEAAWINMARSLEALQQINNCERAAKHAEKHTKGAEAQHEDAEELNGDIRTLQEKAQGILKQAREAQEYGVIWTLEHCLSEYNNSLKSRHRKEPSDKRPLVALFYEIEQHFADIQQGFATVLQRVMHKLTVEWGKRCLSLKEDDDSAKTVVVCQPEKPTREEKRLQELEDYAALRYVAFIRGILTHMRYLMIFLATSFSLVLISLNIYSFEPRQTLIWSFTVIFCLVGVMIVLVVSQVHKDHILSRITGTKPNELDAHFYIRIASLGAVPLLTFLATHFPMIGHYIVSFLQPGLESLK